MELHLDKKSKIIPRILLGYLDIQCVTIVCNLTFLTTCSQGQLGIKIGYPE